MSGFLCYGAKLLFALSFGMSINSLLRTRRDDVLEAVLLSSALHAQLKKLLGIDSVLLVHVLDV